MYTLQAVIDSTPVTLLLDTGAQDLIIDQQHADALGLHVASSLPVFDGAKQMIIAHDGRIGRLTLGTVQLDSLLFVAMDLSNVNQRLQGDGLPRIDGILGATLLMTHGAVIDFGHGMLYLQNQSSKYQ